jgi:hypothetical protein
MDLEGANCDLLKYTVLSFAWRELRKAMKNLSQGSWQPGTSKIQAGSFSSITAGSVN